jgi:Nitroreductase family
MMVNRRTLLIGGAIAIAGAGAVWSGIRRMGSMVEYNAAMATLRAPLPASPDAADLIRFATLAANSHNTQAWQFRAASDKIDILPDLARATPVVDPDNHHLFISLGCAAENLSVAAASRGMPGEVQFDMVTSDLSFTHTTGAATDIALSYAIPLRQSTRGMYDGSSLTPAQLGLLTNAARLPGVDLVLITDPAKMMQLSDLIATGNSAQIGDPAFMAELKHWMRFNPRSALANGDGLFGATSGNPSAPDWLGPTMVDLVFKAADDNTKTAAKIASSSGMAVFVGAREDAASWVQVGRACQRFALQATAMGLKHAFLNQPDEVASLRPDLATLIGMPGRRPDLVMRFGRGAALPFSPRRPVDAVMA